MTTKLEEIIRQFVDDNRISCEECIHQTDRVIENAYGFISDLVNEVGYWYDDEADLEYLEQLEWEKHQEESYGG